MLRPLIACLCVAASTVAAFSAETIPAPPTRYFNDYALTVKPQTAERLNDELADFERATSTQVVAAIFPKMLSDSEVSDYAERVFRAWKIGQKGTDNGVLMLVFIQDHKIWIQTGRGAEGALPDATVKDIVSDQMEPRFKQGDFDGGMTVGVESVMQALKGEYKGSGTTQYDRQHRDNSNGGGFPWLPLLFIGMFVMFAIFRGRRGGVVFSGFGPLFIGGGGGGFGGFGGGSSGGGGGNFFSGGGGDSGGGGAGGSW